MPRAYLQVRSEVAESLRGRFEDWYRLEHVPLALEMYGATAARRFWSVTTPGVHYVMFEFPDLATAQERVSGRVLQFMIEDFNVAWPEGVTRVRELLEDAAE